MEILKSVVALLALIVLSLVIFAILGMNLFGGKLTAEWDMSAVQRGTSVYFNVPIPRSHANGSAYTAVTQRHGIVTERGPDVDGTVAWRVRDEWGAGVHATVVNATLGGLLDASGHILALALEV